MKKEWLTDKSVWERTLYKAKAGDKDGSGKLSVIRQEVAEIIGQIPEDELRRILIGLTEENESFRNHIVAKYASTVSPAQMTELKREIINITDKYSDWRGYIDWENTGAFMRAIEQFLNDRVREVMNKGCYEEAFELVNHVFVTIGNQEFDDSDGGRETAADRCYELWQEILENGSEAVKRQMFQWFEKHQADDMVVDYMEDYIYDFLMNEFHDPELLERKLRMLDEVIAASEGQSDCGSHWSAYYGLENNVLKRLGLMAELGYPETEIQEYKRKNRSFSAIRELEIDEYLEQGDVEAAIRTLKESKELDREYPGLVACYSTRLIDLYSMTNQEQSYKDELVFQVFSYRQDNLDWAVRLKQVCEPAEWEAYREELLTGKHRQQIKYPLMEAEGMYERLLKEITAEDSISKLNQYEKVLKQRFPDQVRAIYTAYVKRQADTASTRQMYKDIMAYLKKIKNYPQGKEAAAELAAEWRISYKRRPAMMDELGKAGF